MRVPPVMLVALLLGCAACSADTNTISAPQLPACDRGVEFDGVPIPKCLADRGVISQETFASAQRIVEEARSLRDSLRPLHTPYAGFMAPYLARSLQPLDDFFARGILDSVLFDRAIDRVAVTLDYARGTLFDNGYVKMPARTRGLVWLEPESSGGLFFQPVTTLLQTGLYYDGATLPLDSMTRTAEAFWHYAMWVNGTGTSAAKRFPLWEYNFYWNGGGIPVQAPWKSGLAQGLALSVFTTLYSRTKDTLWLSRARQTAVSMAVPWSEGGVLLVDASGAWWEEYQPLTRIWNGDAFSVLAVGDYIKVAPEDTALVALYPKSVRAALIYAQAYDTGTWLAYSRTQDGIIAPYQGVYVALAQRLAAQTGDPTWTALANKWASYSYPGPSLPPSMQLVPSDLHAVLQYQPNVASILPH